MKWNGLFLFAVLSLFSFSSMLYSEVVLTDEEYETILTALEKSVTDLEASETANSELKKELNGLKIEAKISANIISLLKLESDLQSKSLKERKNATLVHDLKMFGIGFLSGNLTGGYAGFRAGITLQQ